MTTDNTQQSNRIRWRQEEDGNVGGDGDRNGKWVKEEKERTTIEGRRRRRGWRMLMTMMMVVVGHNDG